MVDLLSRELAVCRLPWRDTRLEIDQRKVFWNRSDTWRSRGMMEESRLLIYFALPLFLVAKLQSQICKPGDGAKWGIGKGYGIWQRKIAENGN